MTTNGSILPIRQPVEVDATAKTLDLTDAGAVLDALKATTARTLLAGVYDDPATASELADRAGTSIQNAQYHLNRLSDAGVVEVVDTWHSTKGREMDVYGPASDPLVIVLGDDVEQDPSPSAADAPNGGALSPSG